MGMKTYIEFMEPGADASLLAAGATLGEIIYMGELFPPAPGPYNVIDDGIVQARAATAQAAGWTHVVLDVERLDGQPTSDLWALSDETSRQAGIDLWIDLIASFRAGGYTGLVSGWAQDPTWWNYVRKINDPVQFPNPAAAETEWIYYDRWAREMRRLHHVWDFSTIAIYGKQANYVSPEPYEIALAWSKHQWEIQKRHFKHHVGFDVPIEWYINIAATDSNPLIVPPGSTIPENFINNQLHMIRRDSNIVRIWNGPLSGYGAMTDITLGIIRAYML